MHIPQDVTLILQTLSANNHEAYIVGGSVRDIIRGVTPKDWDITTSATPNQVMDIFPRTVETGLKHGTVTVLINKSPYEVTTYRIDGEYLDNRRPENVTFTTNIEEDLSRRDFTMNAIAYNPAGGFVDPFGGQRDIASKIIRCVGSPMHRFNEDALRMLRAVRFAGQLGFDIDPHALEAIAKLASSLRNISAERIREELVKLLMGQHCEAVHLLDTTGLLPHILPFYGDLAKIIPMLAICTSKPPLRLALFLAWSGNSCEKIMRNLRFDNKTTQEVSLYVKHLATTIPLDCYQIKKHLRHIPQEQFENLVLLKTITTPKDASHLAAVLRESRDIQAKNECYTLRDLAVSGEDLVAAGIPRGVAIGNKLEELLDVVMRDPRLNSKTLINHVSITK